MKFETREYCPGDEDAINNLYHSVTGVERSVSDFFWQWNEAPAGKSDIWLIFAVDYGEKKLIGHHGVMPLRFTCGGSDLLFGKIENTMVLPEWRSRIVYPRYEIRFKEQYQNRYHALFATMGPAAAIRVRKASGYKFPVSWQSYYLGSSALTRLFCTVDMMKRGVRSVFGNLFPPEAPGSVSRDLLNRSSIALRQNGFLSSLEAENCDFFSKFWPIARLNHEVAPRRDKEDLSWRFWRNPYKQHYTFVLDQESVQRGYAIISISNALDGVAHLEDYAVFSPSEDAYNRLFRLLLDALKRANIRVLSVKSSNDASVALPNRFFSKNQLLCHSLANYFSITSSAPASMPRFVTRMGEEAGLPIDEWAITGLVMEGR